MGPEGKDVIDVPPSHKRYLVLGVQKLLFQLFHEYVGTIVDLVRDCINHRSVVEVP